jgi:hypothetical protein
MWHDVAVAYSKVISRHFPAASEKSHMNHNEDSQCLGRDSNQECAEIKSEALELLQASLLL